MINFCNDRMWTGLENDISAGNIYNKKYLTVYIHQHFQFFYKATGDFLFDGMHWILPYAL